MTFEKPSISETSTIAEIELAMRVCELSEQVTEIRKDALELNATLICALEALCEIGCLTDDECGTCWPCVARLGLGPIPLH